VQRLTRALLSSRLASQALHEQFKSNKVSALPASREKYASPKLGVVSMLGTVESLPSWLWDA
jgi:hypothetical protein